MLLRFVLAMTLLIGLQGPANAALVNHFTFEEPNPPNSPLVDSGTNATNVPLLNGATQVTGGVAGLGQALSTTVVGGSGDDRKAGVFFSSSGASSLTGTNAVSGITLSVWVNPSSFNGTGTQANTVMALLAGGSANEGQSRANISVLANGSIRAGGRKTDPTAGFASAASTSTGLVPLNQWSHLAAVFRYDAVNANNGSIQLYLNGAPIATGALSAAWAAGTTTAATNAKGLVFGSSNASAGTDGEPFNGRIDNARIYNEQLTDGAIQSIYLAEVPEPSTFVLASLAGVGLLLVRRRKLAA